tara:strand:+ start:289 stop:1248 length:960 start_codon:yes stop_codon:yes gene_type:complete
MNNIILVTGCSGFIGFHLSKKLLDEGADIVGIDNMNSYYDINLKKSRLKILNNYPNFKFHQIDLKNYNDLQHVFQSSKPIYVINLAAQAGVRHSITNPMDYVDSNLVGFMNILELSKEYSVQGFIYASSSSVYGGNTKVPYSTDDRVDNPISLYAATKRSNELIANSYSHLFDMNTTGLRFFTVYGPWGRPDMAYYIFTEKISSGQPIKVFNNGNMKRDFTYIDDIVDGVKSAIDKNYKCEVFNLGNNKSENLLDLVRIIEDELGKKATIEYFPLQDGDVLVTHADIDASKNKLGYNPKIDLSIGINRYIDWFKNYKGK